MSVLVEAARPGMLLGDCPENRDRREESAVDRRVAAWFNGRKARRLSMARFTPQLELIDTYSGELENGGPDAAREHVSELRRRLAADGITEELALRVFAAVCVAATTTLGMRPYAEQLFGGWAMLHGCIAEMQTGEGKTLSASLPAITMALAGTPVHVVTVNDYLVQRDADQLRALYGFFGLRVGTIAQEMSDEDRRRAYAADVVYCTNKQLVFDYLRDLQSLSDVRVGLKRQLRSLLMPNPRHPAMRGLCFAIVDEADSVMIDDARTPLILAQPTRTDRSVATEAAVALSIARGLHEGADFRVLQDGRAIKLTDNGLDALNRVAEGLDGVWRFERYRNELTQQALAALHLFRLDRDYIVREDKVQLIDKSTGRILPDRKLQHGLHRMLEVKEKCTVSDDNETLAALSFQRFFARYCHLAGMTGTVSDVRGEMRQVYGLEVVCVPPHKPNCRKNLPQVVLPEGDVQLEYALEEVVARHEAGQPTLVGTRTVALSERFSDLLNERGINHELLNARQDEEESEVVARAGCPGAVTVATNMAGRGTDIPLTGDARELGGLHVINLEVNESRRVDRQLFGRGARQGDPGSCQAIISLKDELVGGALPAKAIHVVARMMERWPAAGGWFARQLVRYAQWRRERQHASERIRVFNGNDELTRQLALSGDME
ncbi:MAG: DEAD/DEAH box helicase [Gammaproteobacteria bacterium]|nr:DEAD/DEAH box helicase [Gammaproteobacteria bacterium]